MARFNPLSWRWIAIILPILALSQPALTADPRPREIVEALFKHDGAGIGPDFSNRDLSSLDLSDVDFKRARLVKADVFGVDLTRSNLRGADLTGARLDRAVITRTDFTGANLLGASIMRPTIFTTLASDRRECPLFNGANLAGSRLTGNFDGTSFTGANLYGLDFGPHEPRADISFYPRNFCRGCDFSGARLREAHLYDASFVRSRFVGADLSGANFVRTDLSDVDLSGADLTGADLTGANLDGTVLTGARGLDKVRGMSLAVNAERAIR